MAHLSPEEAKAVFMVAAKLAEEAMAKKNPSPNFSSWPPEMPERECAWRFNDELQGYRLMVPEPTSCKVKVFKYRVKPKKGEWEDGILVSEKLTHYEDGEFVKILVKENGSSYLAWSINGKTPIFPIPL